MTGVKQPKQLINLKRTQFQLQQVSCVTPLRDCSQAAPKGINSCSSCNELRARYVQLHQKTTKGKKTTPASVYLPGQYCILLFKCHFKSCANGKETVFGCSRRLHCRRSAYTKVHKGPQERQDIAKRLMNGKANCFALLKRITNLKVSILMSSSSTVTRKGVASSGSAAPCRSHHGYYTIEEIHQELSPLTCKLDGKQINL